MEGAMRQGHYTVSRAAVQQRTVWLLRTHLSLRNFGRTCPVDTLLNIVLAAAACITSLFAICQRLRRAPSDETVRKALLLTLPNFAELQRQFNRALAGDLPKALRQRRQPLACDLVLIPYHGEPFRDYREIYRSKPKSGTTHFHAYATAYVIRQGRRYTVALTAVACGEAMEEVLKRLLRQAARAGVRPRYLLLDRGFYSVAVIRYLQRARYPFVMAARFPGRRPTRKRSPAFRFWKHSAWTTHTVTNLQKEQATVGLCVVYRPRRPKRCRRKQRGPQRWIYASWGLGTPSPQWVRQTYRRRFGIETSYRQLNQARIRTTTRNPLLRLFFVGLALLLRNVWVWLHDQVLATPQRGCRRLNLHRLRFRTMLHWLLHVTEQTLGWRDFTQTELPLPVPGWDKTS
jgi:Transposase DDE domain